MTLKKPKLAEESSSSDESSSSSDDVKESPHVIRAYIDRDLAHLEIRTVRLADTSSQPPAVDIDPNASLWTCLEGVVAGDPRVGLTALKERLDVWSAQSQVTMCLGPSYLFDWARDEYTHPEHLTPCSQPSHPSPEYLRKQDIVRRFVVASRGRLLTPPYIPGGDLQAAIDLLKSEAATQHEKSGEMHRTISARILADDAPSQDFGVDAEVDKKWVEQMLKHCCRALEEPDRPDVCHHCHVVLSQQVSHHLGQAACCTRCQVAYCRSCLRKTYDQTLAQMSAPGWICPRCLGGCWCTNCTRLARIVMLKRCFGVSIESTSLSALEAAWFGGPAS